jgi:hypothetical protein
VTAANAVERAAAVLAYLDGQGLMDENNPPDEVLLAVASIIAGPPEAAFRVTIPGSPPSVNEAYTIARKRLILTADARRYKDAAIETARIARGRRVFPEGRWTMRMDFFGSWLTQSGSDRRSDLSNRIKIPEDSLAEGLGVDDSHIWRIEAEKYHDTDAPRVEAALYPYASWS